MNFRVAPEPLLLMKPIDAVPEDGVMTILLQISDAHFGTEQPPVVQALLQLARDQAPDLVVMSGDITQRASRQSVHALRAPSSTS